MKPINIFSNKNISVSFDGSKCANSGLCSKGLSSIVKNSLQPWDESINEENEKIINQIKRCPSGALKVFVNQKVAVEETV